jgi:GTPase SAR1 family protein
MQPVVVVGDCGVGKTLLVRALCGGGSGSGSQHEGQGQRQGQGQKQIGSGGGSGSGLARPAPTVGVHAQPCPVLGPQALLWDCSGSAQSEGLRAAHVQVSRCGWRDG